MSSVGDAIRGHHRQLMARLEAEAAAAEGAGEKPGDAALQAERLVAFLKAELLPHARGEERSLYPAVEPLIRAHGSPTATMRVDHEAIEGYVREIEALAGRLRAAQGRDGAQATRELRRAIWQLEALLRVHLEKEERVYLPLFEAHLPESEQRRVLEAMHEADPGETHPSDAHPGQAEAGGPPAGAVLDVRKLAPPRRHPLIFETFDRLSPGESMVVINDHDPKPLYYQFTFERPGQFTWEYLEQGPEVWRVRIGRAVRA